MDKSRLNHEGLLQLEQPLLKVRYLSQVPLEQLKRAFRSSQKLVEREIQNVLQKAPLIAAASSSEDSRQMREETISKLNNLKRKVSHTDSAAGAKRRNGLVRPQNQKAT